MSEDAEYIAALHTAEGPCRLPALHQELEARTRKAARCERRIAELVRKGETADASDDIKRKTEEVKARKVLAEQRAAELRREIRQIESDVRDSEERLFGELRKRRDKNYEVLSRVKQAVRRLCRELDPAAAECAERLGALLLRTPWFLLQMLREEREELPEVDCDAAWPALELIDQLAQRAEHQDAEAVRQLLALLALPGERLAPQARQHLFRTVADKADLVQRLDQMRVQRGQTAVTAWWQPGNKAYQQLEEWAEDEPLALLKQRLDRELLAERDKEEGLLHLTPLVCKVMLQVSRWAVEELQAEEAVLGCRLTHKDEQHWFFRRKAAGRICQLAAKGNSRAVKLALELLQDEHWMVRQVVAVEMCQLLHVLQAEELEAALQALARLLQLRKTEAQQSICAATEAAIRRELPSYPAQVVQDLQAALRHLDFK